MSIFFFALIPIHSDKFNVLVSKKNICLNEINIGAYMVLVGLRRYILGNIKLRGSGKNSCVKSTKMNHCK